MVYTSLLASDSLELLPLVQRGGSITEATAPKFTAMIELLGECERELGHEHPETLILRSAIAYRLGEAGDPVGAAEAFAELLTDRLRVLGPDHPDTLTTRHNLAHFRGEAGDPAGAAEAFAELLTDRLRVLGLNHPHILTTSHNLTYWGARSRELA
jgi:hypothetical protein